MDPIKELSARLQDLDENQILARLADIEAEAKALGIILRLKRARKPRSPRSERQEAAK